MDAKLFASVFATIFLAELGDKTQLATLLLAGDARNSRWVVFAAASLALVAAAALGVGAGQLVGRVVSPRTLSLVGGAWFVAMGLWILWKARGLE